MKFKSDHNLKDLVKKNPEKFIRPIAKYSEDLSQDFFVKYGQYMLAEYVSDKCAISKDGMLPGATETLSTLKAYALGQQPETKYQNILDPKDREGVDKGFMNISWRNAQFMPIFCQLASSKIAKANIGFEISAIDSISKADKLKIISRMKALTYPDIRDMISATGIQPDNMPNMDGINNENDVDELVKMGKISIPIEAEMKDATDISLRQSKYPTAIKPKLIEDLINTGGAAIHIETLTTGVIRAERVSLKSLIARYSNLNDYSNIDYAGYIRQRTIRELREQGMDERTLNQVAKKYHSEHSNKTLIGESRSLLIHGTQEREEYIRRNGMFPEDNFVVDELVFYCVLGITERMLIEGELNDLGGSVYVDGNQFHNVYGAKWIIGTDLCYDYGLERNIVRKGQDGHQTVELPIKIFMTHVPSMVERAIGIIDDIQIAVLKKRQAIAKMIPGPRIAVDMSKLKKTATIGGKEFNILDALELFPRTGVLTYSSKSFSTMDEDDMLTNQAPPIHFMESGVYEDINIFTSEIAGQLQLLHQITGINKLADGTLENQRLLKDVVVGMRESSENAIEGEFEAYAYLYEAMISYIVEKWRVSVINGDIDLSGIYGYPKKITKELFKHIFDINVLLLPGEEDKMMMIQKLEDAFNKESIALDSYYAVIKLIKEGDISKAQLLLGRAVRDYAAKKHQQDIEKIQSQPKAQAEMQQVVIQGQMALEEHKAKMQILVEKAKEEEKRKTKMMELQAMREQGRENAEASLINTSMKANNSKSPEIEM